MDKKEVGKILTELRKQAGMSRKDVGAFLGRSDKTIAHWETGYTTVDANILFTLCKLYGTDVNTAFGFSNSGKRDLDAEILSAFHRSDKVVQDAVLRLLNLPPLETKNEQVS